MRVTNATSYRNLLHELAIVQERMETAQMQISSGKRVSVPSDDPSTASDIIRLSSEKNESAQFSRNLDFAKTKLELADTVLDGIERMVERVRSLGQIAMSSSTAASANITEVTGLRDQIIAAANTTHAGRFIFGGSVTTTQPYPKAMDGSVAYQGNDDQTPVQVSRSLSVQTQIPGSDIFTASVDIFATISRLANAMQASDKTQIDAEIRNLERFSETLSVSRSKIGNYVNLANNIESDMTAANLAREKDLDEAGAADLAKAITDFQMSGNALQAIMSVGSRISQLNLLDFLK